MKKLKLLIGFWLITFALLGQNRVATLLDVAKYGTYMTVGDWIGDTPTKINTDGINQLRYTNFSKSFPGVRENANLWIDGDKIGRLCEIRLLNGTEATPWHITSAALRPIPNTRIDGIYTANSYGGFLYLVQGLLHFKMDGNSDKYPGFKGIKKGDFVKGRFGFGGTSTGYYGGYHVYSISVLNGGSFYYTGLEGEHGFSAMRFQGGTYDWNVSLDGDNFYFHDTESEGQYIKATHAPPLAKGPVRIRDGIIARSGSEGLQLQHLSGDSHIHNITIFGPACGYLCEFQPGQDTGIQLNPDAGNTIIENLIVDSWGSHALNLFGSEDSGLIKNTTIRNIGFFNGRGEVIYPHNSCKWGMTWLIDNIFVRNLTGEYYINSKTTRPNWTIGINSGTDKITVTNTFFKDLPDVEYVNSGFYEPANKIKFYRQYYGKYITGVDLKPVDYKVGEVLQDREPLFLPVWVKVLSDFTADGVRPKNRLDCMILTWDSKGVRNDQPSWNGASEQKAYPPDDLRVVYDNFYALRNMGYIEEKPTYESLLSKIERLEVDLVEKDSVIAELNLVINSKDEMINGLSDMVLKSKDETKAISEKLNALVLSIDEALTQYK
jgi:hypothetical protein